MGPMKNNKEFFDQQLNKNKGLLLYFATLSCSVGEALEPKVKSLVEEKFPKLVFSFVDMNAVPEFAAAHQVFAEPTILLFVDGREYLRKSRHIGLQELEMGIERIYQLAFE